MDNAPLPLIDATELKRRLDAGEALLIDIREPSEFAREHILGARLVPLSALDRHEFDRELTETAVFYCKSGNRTAMNAARLLGKGFTQAYLLRGGLDAWRAAGLPVHVNRDAPIDIQRQVMLTAGSLGLFGALLAWFVHPAFVLIPGFIGAGLSFAGITGFCGMAKILALMPWNRRALAGIAAEPQRG